MHRRPIGPRGAAIEKPMIKPLIRKLIVVWMFWLSSPPGECGWHCLSAFISGIIALLFPGTLFIEQRTRRLIFGRQIEADILSGRDLLKGDIFEAE